MTNAPISRTSDFLGTIGVQTHIPYTDGGYANLGNITADLAYLGISQVRDGITDSSARLSDYIKLAKQGIKFTLCVVDASVTDTASLNAKLALVQRLAEAVPGSVIAVEGANEINNWPVSFNGVGGLEGAIDLQKALYAAVHGNPVLKGVAVDYFTGYAAGGVATGPDPSTTPGLADFNTQHPYPRNGDAPASYVDPVNAAPNEVGHPGPIVYTETGYSSNGGTWSGVSEAVQAKYTLDLLFDAAKQGVAQTDLYELMDAYAKGSPQGNDGWGLFAYGNTAKPVATALHNLTTILADKGASAATFETGTLVPTITGLPASGQTLVLQKSSGIFDIVVWAEPKIWDPATGKEIVAATNAVTVNLGGTYGTVAIYDPMMGTAPIGTLTNVEFLQIGLTDHPLILEVGPKIAAPPAVTITAQRLASDTGASGSDNITRDGTVTLSGTVTRASGTTVRIFDAATALGTASLGEGNTWSYTTTLVAGVHALNAVATDPAGNSAATATAAAITVLTAQPSITLKAQRLTADTGSSTSDNITRDGAITLSGTLDGPAGTVVTMFDGTSALGTATLGTGGSWSFATTLAAGTHALAAVATDLAGNSATTSAAPTVTVLTTAPKITVLGTTLSADATSATMFGTVSGAPGTLVTVANGATTVGTAMLDGKGGWAYTARLTPGRYGLTATATDPAGNTGSAASTISVPAPQVSTPASVAASPDTLVLNLSEDAYKGDAQYTVSVDGTQVGGTRTATASHSAGQSQNVAITGVFGPGIHTVGIDFLNDLWGGSATTDRNLYVNAITLNSSTTATGNTQNQGGLARYQIGTPAAPTDTITLQMSEDAYRGDAQFAVLVDGQQIGGVRTVTASHGSGQSQSFTIAGNFGTGAHVVGVTFLNDLWGGSANYDRNLHVDAITYDGGSTNRVNTTQAWGGMVSYKVAAPVSAPNVLSLQVSEDAYKGDAQFTVSVDGQQVGGVQTVTSSHGAGHVQTFAYAGNFGTGTHVVGVTFLNDLYDGTAATDRNLYVKSAALDGTATSLNAAQMSGGLASYTVQTPTVGPGTAKGSLALSVDAGTTLILDETASAGALVTFTGTGAVAQFTDAGSFHGALAGFGAGDTLDLRSIGFGAKTTLGYDGKNGTGTLTVSDGAQTAKLDFQGSYTAANFHAAEDGRGGTAITFAR